MDFLPQLFGSDSETITWWQMSARAAFIVVYAVVLLRLGARRIFGRDTAVDIIVGVIVGSALSRALTGNASLLPTLAATAVLLALHWLIIALAVRFNWFSRLTKGRPTQLIDRGRVDWRRTRRALIGEHDLEQELRLHGVAGPDAVESAHLERNGRISVVVRSG